MHDNNDWTSNQWEANMGTGAQENWVLEGKVKNLSDQNEMCSCKRLNWKISLQDNTVIYAQTGNSRVIVIFVIPEWCTSKSVKSAAGPSYPTATVRSPPGAGEMVVPVKVKAPHHLQPIAITGAVHGGGSPLPPQLDLSRGSCPQWRISFSASVHSLSAGCLLCPLT